MKTAKEQFEYATSQALRQTEVWEEKVLDECFKIIEEQSEIGRFNAYIHYALTPSIQEKLESLGYKVFKDYTHYFDYVCMFYENQYGFHVYWSDSLYEEAIKERDDIIKQFAEHRAAEAKSIKNTAPVQISKKKWWQIW